MIHGNERIRELAALYQSPGTIGRYMAQLASTGSVERDDILTDIGRARAEYSPFQYQIHAELNELQRWANKAEDDEDE